ncbi:CPBP family intramembrane glutamic endopeptidase [Candidatus Methylacidiphilum infernorum]|uniref:Predicted metal-dependent membrane protease n=1 Tax=Methylacidiphilum infernorum (isolate V4) TaxID=481448 RepID=B3DWZ4_METI4|nr:CPBP family intramembrane glutamic endopeptidase [Candidatus Methylacidiphilum infernorum]ACD82134.1 Predicted metal-dependent membrane protease [Methylacidiphilum infernorum V4]
MDELTQRLIVHYKPLIVGFILLTFLADFLMGLFLFRWKKSGFTPFGEFLSIPFSWWELLAVSLFLFSGILLGVAAGLSIFSIFLVVLLVRFHGYNLSDYLGVSLYDPLKIAVASFWICLSAYLPLQMLAGLSETIGRSLHLPVPRQPAVDLFLHASKPIDIVIILSLILIAAPIGEELLFRGFLYQFLRYHFTRRKAIVISGLIFALLHIHWITFLPLFFFGMILAVVYEFSGSLVLSMAVHFWFNGFTACLLLLAKYG